jgi:hypothetical protein
MSRRTASVRSGSTVDMEVANLFKLQNKNQFTNALLALRQRYRDEDLVGKIQDVFMQRHSSIVKSAKKFATAVREKYAQQNIPFHQLLMKARAHGKKHHLSEAEFAEFQRIYEQELAGANSSEVVIPMTSIMKVLGNIEGSSEAYFKTDDADMRNLQEILKLNEASKPLHAQVLLQAIQYNGAEATFLDSVVFEKGLMNPGDHVHPVVVALFLPKFKTVDEHFLYSNMSGIIKARYNRTPLTTRPDYELFYNLVTDPNDVVCDTRTPVGDLLHRCNLQNQLWNSVLHLRNGQYFNTSLREFMTSVDVCRLNKYDNPDLVYGRHDGTIIKRLFSAFSFRPTIVATLPVANLFAYNPYSQNLRPTVTSIPMVNVRLSNFNTTAANAAVAASVLGARPAVNTLTAALSQTNQFLEGNVVVNRHTSVMFSREVLVFYIDRRSYVYKLNTSITNLARLPTSIAGFERINDLELEWQDDLPLGGVDADGRRLDPNGEVYEFRSAVVADVNTNVDPTISGNYVVGSSAIIKTIDGNFYHYTPGTCIARKKEEPIIYIDENDTMDAIGNVETIGWRNTVKTRGVILVYSNPSYKDMTAISF